MKFCSILFSFLSLGVFTNAFLWSPLVSVRKHFPPASKLLLPSNFAHSATHSRLSALFSNTYSEEQEEEEEEESEEIPQPVVEEEESAGSAVVIDGDFIKEAASFVGSLNGSDVRVGIIMARWNEDIIKNLYQGVNQSLTECGVKPTNIFSTYVPGSFELPITARFLAMSKRVDVIICIGCLIKGETMHFEYISDAVANGIMQVSLETLVPCIFGVLTVLSPEQATARSVGNENLGLGWGKAAVEMGLARMSAMGMGKMAGKSAEPNSAFVSFNSTSLPTVKESEDQKKKKIGF